MGFYSRKKVDLTRDLVHIDKNGHRTDAHLSPATENTGLKDFVFQGRVSESQSECMNDSRRRMGQWDAC